MNWWWEKMLNLFRRYRAVRPNEQAVIEAARAFNDAEAKNVKAQQNLATALVNLDQTKTEARLRLEAAEVLVREMRGHVQRQKTSNGSL